MALEAQVRECASSSCARSHRKSVRVAEENMGGKKWMENDVRDEGKMRRRRKE